MRRGLAQQMVLVALGVLAAMPACGFPSLNYEDGATGDAAADGRPQGDSASPLDAPVEADGSLDGPADDATSEVGADAIEETPVAEASVDARADAPSGEDSGNPCDRDGDGYPAQGACGGTDCCDTDSSANPGVKSTAWFTKMPDQCGNWDYNCDGKVEEEFPVTLTCGGLAATGCTGGSGFMGDPGCGSTGPVYACSPNGLGCKAALTGSAPQGCH